MEVCGQAAGDGPARTRGWGGLHKCVGAKGAPPRGPHGLQPTAGHRHRALLALAGGAGEQLRYCRLTPDTLCMKAVQGNSFWIERLRSAAFSTRIPGTVDQKMREWEELRQEVYDFSRDSS